MIFFFIVYKSKFLIKTTFSSTKKQSPHHTKLISKQLKLTNYYNGNKFAAKLVKIFNKYN